jgi:hypothetical protein
MGGQPVTKDVGSRSRLEEHPRKISWTSECSVFVGYHRCGNCDAETPTPTDDILLAFAIKGGGYLWPGESWTPPRWIQVRIPPGGYPDWICGDCAQVVQAALDTRKTDL